MKVSIVLPSYNHARFLPGCLGGVIAQTYEDWELLFLDDLSSDDSRAVAANFTDPRIRFLPNEVNLGTYATQNRGLDLATGDLVAILNSDDAWLPTKLERQVELFRKHPDAIVGYTRGIIIDDADQPWAEQNHHRDYPTSERHDVLPYLMNVNQILASSVVFRRGAVRFERDFRYCGDWVAAIRLARQSDALFVDEPLTLWRQHPGNSSKQLAKTIAEEVSVRQGLLNQAPRWLDSRSRQPVGHAKLALGALDLAAHQLLLGKSAAARASCARAYRWGSGTTRKTALRRWVATFLPPKQALRRLWPDHDPAQFLQIAERSAFDFESSDRPGV